MPPTLLFAGFSIFRHLPKYQGFRINPEIGRPEHRGYRWSSYSETEKFPPPRLLPVIRLARDAGGGSQNRCTLHV